jgi:hypothetical protein
MENVLDTETYPYRLTIGDARSVARTYDFKTLDHAEQCARAKLGCNWGDNRIISVATFYEWDGVDHIFLSEMEW